MDYSFANASVEIEKNFSKDEQVKVTAVTVAGRLKEKEEKDNA